MFRAAVGLALAACVAMVARRTRSLTDSGALAATIIGCAAVATGWSWAAILIVYFVSSTLLSRAGRTEKERRTTSIVAKGGARDAVQVVANGGVFAAAAIAMLVWPDIRWMALGAGSLAASAADTWATEIGTLKGGEPRSILTAQPVRPGTSGGITLKGSVAAGAGAGGTALVVLALGWPAYVAARVLIGGVAGAFLDSVLGATLQVRRWCDACEGETERTVHDCGTPTRPLRGMVWLDNDTVNFLSSAAGGLLAALLTKHL